jgi:hypothetical protein
MIISHKHKFIYLRSQKTASTSLDVFFSAYCDTDDIVTKMPEDVPEWHRESWDVFGNSHVAARTVRDYMGDEFWNYYKFTSVRNPLDKIISSYFWWREMPQLGPGVRPLDFSFNDWVLNYGFEHEMAIFHAPYYKIYGEIVVDDFIRYESLEDDVKRICKKVGIKYDPKYLLHYKKTKRREVDVSEEALNKLRRIFADELTDLNYTI